VKPLLAIAIVFALAACSYDAERVDTKPRPSSRPSRYHPAAQRLPQENYHPELMKCRSNACVELCANEKVSERPKWCAGFEPQRRSQ
jgi:hypothetical protein